METGTPNPWEIQGILFETELQGYLRKPLPRKLHGGIIVGMILDPIEYGHLDQYKYLPGQGGKPPSPRQRTHCTLIYRLTNNNPML